MNDKVTALLKSRRFWVAAGGLLAVVGSELFGIQLDPDQITAVAAVVVAWVLGDSIRKTS